jgi:ABC-2 type transport system permease protein
MSAAEPALRRSITRELSACAALFTLTLRQLTHGRRVLVLALLYALPCGLAVLLRSLPHPAPPEALEFALVFNLLPHALAPFTALLYASGIINDEVEEQTLTYLLMRSVPRWALYLTKLVATWCVAGALVAAATVAIYAAAYWNTSELWTEVLGGRALRAAAVMVLAQAAYCALFGFVGLLTRRSLIAGIGYIVVVEGFLANIDFVLRRVTVVYHVRTLVLRWLGLPPDSQQTFERNWRMEPQDLPTTPESVRTLLLAAAALALVSSLWFARREFRVKTPES